MPRTVKQGVRSHGTGAGEARGPKSIGIAARAGVLLFMHIGPFSLYLGYELACITFYHDRVLRARES